MCVCAYVIIAIAFSVQKFRLLFGGPLGHPLQDFQGHVLGRIEPAEGLGPCAWVSDFRAFGAQGWGLGVLGHRVCMGFGV